MSSHASNPHAMNPFDLFSHIIWRPGIGDNTWTGWFTVGLYYLTAGLALAPWVQQRSRPSIPGDHDSRSSDTRFYWGVALLLLTLGIVRQTGLLRWFTELGRAVAWKQGWYWHRTQTQQAIIQSLYYGSGLFFFLLAWLNRRTIIRHGVVLLGIVFLVGFTSIRAVSLHAIDTMFAYRRVVGVPLGTLLEVGALVFIAAALLLPLVLGRRIYTHVRMKSGVFVNPSSRKGSQIDS